MASEVEGLLDDHEGEFAYDEGLPVPIEAPWMQQEVRDYHHDHPQHSPQASEVRQKTPR